MSTGWWYLRRAVPWTALLGCCAVTAVVWLLLERWPSTALALMPMLLAGCAAAAGFCFDESTLPVVEVTPRGATWRRLARLAVALVPLAVWSAAIWWQPGDLALDRSTWWLVGVAAIGLAAGAAALASRRSVAAPGSVLASLLAVGLLTPLVLGMFLDLGLIYPFDGLNATGRWFWVVVGASGVGACAVALRPGVRH